MEALVSILNALTPNQRFDLIAFVLFANGCVCFLIVYTATIKFGKKYFYTFILMGMALAYYDLISVYHVKMFGF